MSVKAKIIADSRNPDGVRLTSFLVTYPRFVHAEHLRHRMHSFNVASSRAIPTKKFRELVVKETALPVWWGKNQSGMAAREELDDLTKEKVQTLWQEALSEMCSIHTCLEGLGLHKQICNRILEPWMPVTVLVTGTDWANFYKLRCHPDAQPEIQAIADAMLYQYVNSTPTRLNTGQWHIPFSNSLDTGLEIRQRLMISAARCARLSYLTFDGVNDVHKDIKLAESLMANGHWSPFEHQAVASNDKSYHANFRGWVQYRKMHEGETAKDEEFDFKALLEKRVSEGSKYAC